MTDNKKLLNDKWAQAVETGEPIDIGNIVVCDGCDEDYTNSKAIGGLIFGSRAYCPTCAVKQLISIRQYNEEKYIKAYCPANQTFADFVRAYRGKNNYIQITKGN